MKNFKLSLSILLTFSFLCSFAQIPNKISYQAVVRNNSNELVVNSQIGIKIMILQGSENGTLAYSQVFTSTTNSNGLISLEIGGDNDFESINWDNGPYFIRTQFDINGGTNYTITATSQLLTVPYALHAKTAENITGNINITETDPVFTSWDKDYNDLSNKPTIPANQTLNYNSGVLSISNGNSVNLPTGGASLWTQVDNHIAYDSGDVAIMGTDNYFRFLNNTQTSPGTDYSGGALSWNLSGGLGEFNIWNTYTAASKAFAFNKVNANGSSSEFLTIMSSGNVGIGNTNPSEMLSVGVNQSFQVNSTGNIKKINNVTTSFPTTQGAVNTYLKNDGSGNLSWAEVNGGSSSSNANIFNVIDYGASNDGTNETQTTAAVNSAIQDYLALGAEAKGVIYFPPGKYKLSQTISVSLTDNRQGITIRGEGSGISVLEFTSGAGTGIHITFGGGTGYEGNKGNIVVKDLTVETDGAGAAYGIHYECTAGTTSPGPHKIIENVTLSGTTASNYWQNGIRLTNSSFTNISGVQYQGNATGAWAGVGIYIGGTNDPVDIFITTFRAWNLDKGIEITGNTEGITIDKSIILSVNKGIHWHTTSKEPWLSINNCHISAKVDCIKAENAMQCQINNNLLYCQAEDATAWTGIYVENSSASDYDFMQISHNTIHGFQNNTTRNGIILNNVKNSLAMANIFYDTVTSIFLSNVTNSKFLDNMHFGNANEVYEGGGCSNITIR